MKVYKENQFLVFDFENGKKVKYDFARQEAIGISGKVVHDLRSQLRSYRMSDIIESCTDKNYSRFLRYVYRNSHCENVGSVLAKIPRMSQYEQIFSAGIELVSNALKYSINDIPKCLLKIIKSNDLVLTNELVEIFKAHPNECCLAFELKYENFSIGDIVYILQAHSSRFESRYFIATLLQNYGYSMKPLMLYLDRLATYEAIHVRYNFMCDFHDYIRMMAEISSKFDKYPRNFLTTHAIASRNFERLKKEFSEEQFKARRDLSLEASYKDYIFIYPKTTDEIKEEAVQQNNCVASYIDRVINGECHILFLRKKDSPDKSLVTIEVRNNQIIQARQKFNDPVNEEEQSVIDKWNIDHKIREAVA